ncbi:hypothetical protein EDB82DRAFT_486473 [Fusarium venenatum]|nr:hypothetical protein EDB82DRAFT_486473 [Fusarium venenatum]
MEETRGYLTCLAFQIYGCDPDLSMNPPTVYIAVDDRSDERGWYGVVSAVKDILRAADGLSHVQVHIETTKNDLLSNFD